jgi:hypothetical protein
VSPTSTASRPRRLVVGEWVRPEIDVHLLSYPKAGRTWLRALIGKALTECHGLPESMLLDTFAVTRAAGLVAAGFDHDLSAMILGLRWQDMPTDRSAYAGKRVLLLGRDVRDILVSAYFQATRRINVFDGPISDFVRDDAYGVEKVLAFYRIWAASRHIPAQFEFLTYEALHRDTAGSLARVLRFLEADVTPAIVGRAVDYCRFDNLRRAEATDHFNSDLLRPGRAGDPEAFKVRRGEVGKFAQYLSSVDIAYIDAAIAERGCEFTRPEAFA